MKKILLFLLTAVLLLQACCAAADFSVGDKGQEVLEIKERLKELRYITDGKLTKTYTDADNASQPFVIHTKGCVLKRSRITGDRLKRVAAE